MNREDLRNMFLRHVSILKMNKDIQFIKYNEAIETQAIPEHEFDLELEYQRIEFHTHLPVLHNELFVISKSGKIHRLSFTVTRLDGCSLYATEMEGRTSEIERYMELRRDMRRNLEKLIND